MVATKVTKLHFSGNGNVYSQAEDGLAQLVRKLAQDNARLRVANITDFTDSSGGTATYPAALAAQSGESISAFTETGTASAQKAAFDTAIGKVENAMSVMVEWFNRVNAPLGLPLITDNAAGTIATAGTIAALDLSLSGVASSCVPVADAQARFETIRDNMAVIAHAANRIAVAVGEEKMTVSALGASSPGGTLAIANIAATGTAVDGSADSTISAADATTELAAIGNNIATIAQFFNDIMGAQDSDLTGNSNGTASTSTIEAMTIPSTAEDGAATTSSPKAGFDTAIANIEDSLSELSYIANRLLRRQNSDETLLTDSTGVTPNGALPNTAVDLTAVDGSSGTNAVDFTTGVARMGTIRDGIASITAKVNVLCALYGLPVLTDSSGGTASDTIADIAATGTGVGGAASTILDTVADAFLLATCNNLETLKVKLNLMLSATNATDVPNQIVAWDD